MLPQAALRALRTRSGAVIAFPSIYRRTIPPSITSVSSQWSNLRYYANDRRPPPSSNKDHTYNRSDPIKFGESSKSTDDQVHPGEQPEFDTAADPKRNTAPETAPDNAPGQAQKPLPDLRYGIPSTFGDEFAKSTKQEHDPNNVTDDPDKDPASGRREGGELPKSAYETSTDRRRNRVANVSYLLFAATGLVGALYLGRNWDTEEEEQNHADAPSGWTPMAMYNRAAARLKSQMGYYTEPTFTKLLPDMDPAPPMTLVLSLEDLLVHSEWSAQQGWRVAKRPGVDYFLRYLSQYYELVIFTSVRSMDADPIIRKLDPFRIVMWPLFREATRYEGGEYIKVCYSSSTTNRMRTYKSRTSPISIAISPKPSLSTPILRMSSSSPIMPSFFPNGKATKTTKVLSASFPSSNTSR